MLQTGSSPMNPENVRRVLDLGCGPGNITPFLKEAFPAAHITGIDSSAEMINAARKKDSLNDVDFRVATIESLVDTSRPESFDVVYSNAALHWVPGHNSLFPQLMHKCVAPNGVLGVQMPDTRTQLSHTLLVDVCKKCGFGDAIRSVRIPRVEKDASKYYDIMHGECSDIDMWSTEYVQQLASEPGKPHPVLEYVRATGMMPIIEALGGPDSDKTQKFLDMYEQLLCDVYPNRFRNKAGDKSFVLFPFKRFFLVAKK